MTEPSLVELTSQAQGERRLEDWKQSKPNQLSLFAEFEQDQRFGNTLSFYDSLPKYVLSQRAIDTSRPVHKVERSFTLNKQDYKLKILPAVLDDEEGQRQKFPGEREELVEDALRKIALRSVPVELSRNGCSGTGVLFSLYELCQELKTHGHAFALDKVREAIVVLAKSQIELRCETDDNTLLAGGPYFPFYSLRTRRGRSPVNAGGDTKCYVMFHPLVTEGIQNGEFRQYNYQVSMQLKFLERWLQRALVNRFLQAAPGNEYTIRASTIMRGSGCGPYTRTCDWIRVVKKSLDNLISKDVVQSFDHEIEYDPGRKNRMIDALFHIRVSTSLFKEIRRANSIQRDIRKGDASTKKFLPAPMTSVGDQMARNYGG